LQRNIKVAELTNPFIASIYVFFEYQNYLLTFNDGKTISKQEDEWWWYKDYKNRPPDEKTWFHSYSNNNSYISQFRMLSNYSKDDQGVIIVNLDIEKLGAMITNTIQPQ